MKYLPFEVLAPGVVITLISALGPVLDLLDLLVRLELFWKLAVLTL